MTKTTNNNDNNKMQKEKQQQKQISLKEYPIIELNVKDIKEDKTNPNVMTLEQSRGLEKSMINFGRLKFIVVDQNNIIIDGYHRLEVEKAIGTKKVKVLKVKVKDEIEKKIIWNLWLIFLIIGKTVNNYSITFIIKTLKKTTV